MRRRLQDSIKSHLKRLLESQPCSYAQFITLSVGEGVGSLLGSLVVKRVGSLVGSVGRLLGSIVGKRVGSSVGWGRLGYRLAGYGPRPRPPEKVVGPVKVF